MSESNSKQKKHFSSIGRDISAIIAAAGWIMASEFIRNQYLIRSLWEGHYKQMGLVFPSGSVNGMMWGVWSVFLAVLIYVLSGRFGLVKTTLLAWLSAFLMMWLVINNLGVLPTGCWVFTIPLSLLETFVAAIIIRRIRE